MTESQRSRAEQHGFDRQIIEEAEKQRLHESVLQEQQHAHERDLEEIRTNDRADRRVFIGWVLVGLAILAAIGGIVGVITFSTQQDRKIRERIAQECIRAGNIWVDSNCLLSRKEPQ